jgi:hypothetical protein
LSSGGYVSVLFVAAADSWQFAFVLSWVMLLLAAAAAARNLVSTQV